MWPKASTSFRMSSIGLIRHVHIPYNEITSKISSNYDKLILLSKLNFHIVNLPTKTKVL